MILDGDGGTMWQHRGSICWRTSHTWSACWALALGWQLVGGYIASRGYIMWIHHKLKGNHWQPYGKSFCISTLHFYKDPMGRKVDVYLAWDSQSASLCPLQAVKLNVLVVILPC